MRSSASSRGASRSRPTSTTGYPRSRSWACPTVRARRRGSACAAASTRPSSTSPAVASPSTSHLRGCARRAPATTSRSRWRSSRRRSRSRTTSSRATPPSASSRSTGDYAASAASSRSPRARAAWASNACSARSSRQPRRCSQASTLRASATSPTRSRTSAASSSRIRCRLRARSRRLRLPTLQTCAARSGHAAGSRSPPPARTTSCSPGRPARARRCSRGGCRRSCRALDRDAALEVTRIHSVAGMLSADQPLIDRPPFRAPHHSASTAAIVGGGPSIRPGEASLAHRGVLLLDELAEFARPALEGLRQPLEDGVVTIARAGGRATFPACFQLVATMNMCPCGARGDPAATCTCSAQRLSAYRDKLSRALLDRFDLVIAMPRPRATELASGPAEATQPIAARVDAARQRLAHAQPNRSDEAQALLSRAVERLPLSGRGRARVGRVARTIAALAGADAVEAEHVAEALAYRSPKELDT